jgi:hypothetical protein
MCFRVLVDSTAQVLEPLLILAAVFITFYYKNYVTSYTDLYVTILLKKILREVAMLLLSIVL